MAFEDLAPRYIVDIEETALGPSITQFITQVEYESADGMADMAKIVVQNPDQKIADLKILQAGNEMSIWFGYGSQIKHIGRVTLRRARYNFPQSDVSQIEVSGYTADAKMMDNAPEKGKDRYFKKVTYAEIAARVADRYGFGPDIDPTPDEPDTRTHKAGVTDYQLVKACANLTGFFFWVDWDPDANLWVLHFKDPANVLDAVAQPDFTFRYNDGDLSSLLSFQPELLIQGARTKLKVLLKNHRTGAEIEEEIEEDTESADILATDETSEVEDEHKGVTPIKVFLGEFSFELEGAKKFKTAAEAKQWAAQWFRRHRENFILGSGMTIGAETLMSRQIHTLEGLSKTLDGKWYFSNVRHTLSESDGYVCSFKARKQDSLA